MGAADRAALLTAPAVSLTVLVVGAGAAAVVATSFGLFPIFGPAAFTVSGYSDAAGDLARGVAESVAIAGAATTLAVVVGLVAALRILSSQRSARMVAGLGAAVVGIPHLVGAVSVGLLLADGGVFTRAVGVPQGNWPELVGGPWQVAVIAEFAWKESAFVALFVVASLSRQLVDLTETAALLGAGPRQRLWRVTLPAAAPALGAAALIVFVYTSGAYEVAWLLGRAYPEPLPVMAYRLFTSIDLAARPQAAAAAVTAIVVALAAAAVSAPLLRRLGAAR